MFVSRLKRKISCEGKGLHSGAPSCVTFIPSRDHGIFFRKGKTIIPANCAGVVSTARGVSLGKGSFVVKTVEHLLAAIRWMGILGLEIEVDGEEIPVLDGSARPWVELLRNHLEKTSNRFPMKGLKGPIMVNEGDSFVEAVPADHFSIEYSIEFPLPVGRQKWTGKITPEIFQNNLAPARTFGFVEEVAELRNQGLAMGGNLENCVVITKDLVLTPLRFKNEMVRHKALDLLGDLALLPWIPKTRIKAQKASHRLHIFLAKMLENDAKHKS